MKTDTENIINRLPLQVPPLQSWENETFDKAGIRVNILRLDLIHPTIGGNKWMKLKGFLEQAIRENKAGILTKGGPWSNHVHASASACRLLDLSFQVWIKGHDKIQTVMLQDIIDSGASVKFINRTDFYNEMAAEDFAEKNNLLYVPMGGADDRGVNESALFLSNVDLPEHQYAVCAVGTGTTFGGLAFAQHPFETVVGIDAGTNDPVVATKINTWQQQLSTKKLILLKDYDFGGFARHRPELLQFANGLWLQTGIPTDIVYTAKLFFAVKHLVEKGFFQQNSSVLLVHSGGLQGNRSLPQGLLQF